MGNESKRQLILRQPGAELQARPLSSTEKLSPSPCGLVAKVRPAAYVKLPTN
jgi:hypothetical protein